jgi:protein gp37
MGKTSIEWTDETWNPIRGVAGNWHCTHVSEGCRNCYAERLNIRFGGPAFKPGVDSFRLDEKILEQPLHWKKPRKVFVCDMTDLFHEDIPFEWIFNVFSMMSGRAFLHTYQVLTKRPQRMLAYMNWMIKRAPITKHPPPNIWLGVSVEDQATAGERIPLLLQTPAAVRFVSYEPALEQVDFQDYLPTSFKPWHFLPNGGYLDWLIVGGESGPHARPFDLAWARSAIAQCREAGAACFVKQLGAKPMDVPPPPPGGRYIGERPGQLWQVLLRDNKGGDQAEWPEDVRVREWPNNERET